MTRKAVYVEKNATLRKKLIDGRFERNDIRQSQRIAILAIRRQLHESTIHLQLSLLRMMFIEDKSIIKTIDVLYLADKNARCE